MPNRYFNITAGDDKDAPSVINTHQSAITFAGAPAIVTIVVKVLGAAVPPLAESKLLLVGLSLIVRLLIYWNTAPTRQTRKDKVLGVVFAFINSFAIAAAALGICAELDADMDAAARGVRSFTGAAQRSRTEPQSPRHL